MIKKMNCVLKDYGWCQILQRDEEYVIRYDRGGIAVNMVEANLSIEEAQRALANELEAEKLVIELQKRDGL